MRPCHLRALDTRRMAGGGLAGNARPMDGRRLWAAEQPAQPAPQPCRQSIFEPDECCASPSPVCDHNRLGKIISAGADRLGQTVSEDVDGLLSRMVEIANLNSDVILNEFSQPHEMEVSASLTRWR
jgi:hypothetical protein